MAVKVLLVEDEERVRYLLRGRLEAGGYTVIEASSAEDAIARYRNGPPDVVVTDIVLPGKSGLDLIGELRRTFPGVRVVAMSGAIESDVPALLEHSKELGVIYGLPKPFTTTQLLEAVERTLAGPAISPTLGEIGDSAAKRLRTRWALLLALLLLVGLVLGIALLRR